MWTKNVLLGTMAVLLSAFMSYAYAHEPLKIEIDDNSEYVVYYNAFKIKDLPKEMARTYKIKRTSHNGVLNVSVRKGSKGKMMGTTAVKANVTVQITDLIGIQQTPEIKEVEEGKEGDAVYYIGEFDITSEPEILKFTIQVDPDNQGKEYEISFRQTFYVD
jgi:hypothetical protein